MDEQTLLQSHTIQLCSPKKTLLELSLQVPVGQVWTLFECALEVMYTQTQLKSADNFARPVNLLLKKNKDYQYKKIIFYHHHHHHHQSK